MTRNAAPATPAGRPGPPLRRNPWRWGLVLAYMLAIFLSSSRSDVAIPGGVSDKAAHAVMYGGLALVAAWAFAGGDRRRVGLWTVCAATLLSVAYGLTDEVHQLFVPRRAFEWFDLAADATGSLAATGALWAWGIISRGSAPSHDV